MILKLSGRCLVVSGCSLRRKACRRVARDESHDIDRRVGSRACALSAAWRGRAQRSLLAAGAAGLGPITGHGSAR